LTRERTSKCTILSCLSRKRACNAHVGINIKIIIAHRWAWNAQGQVWITRGQTCLPNYMSLFRLTNRRWAMQLARDYFFQPLSFRYIGLRYIVGLINSLTWKRKALLMCFLSGKKNLNRVEINLTWTDRLRESKNNLDDQKKRQQK